MRHPAFISDKFYYRKYSSWSLADHYINIERREAFICQRKSHLNKIKDKERYHELHAFI
jgi:hypothetical protein